MKVSNHARKRLKERCGLGKNSHDRAAEMAMNDGLHHKECTGRLKKYVDYLFLSYKKGNNIRLYGDNVYIFHDNTLITVMKIPNYHKNAVNKLTSRKRKAESSTQPSECLQ